MKHINYKSRKNIVATLLLAAALIWPAVAWCQTTLYKQYKHRTDFVAMCIMNYPITDSVKVDVTMLVPQTKEAVYYLVEEFNLGLDKEKVYNRFEKEERYTLYTYNVRKDNIKKCFGPITSDEDYKNISILAYNYNMGIIIIFHDINTEDRYKIINRFLIKTLKQLDLLPKTTNGIDNK
ncbi:MAG: hypothetical protein J6V54_02335 [Bacteroidales bacterium]|nr:hypothetical protein [Bacteroidales bacterium]